MNKAKVEWEEGKKKTWKVKCNRCKTFECYKIPDGYEFEDKKTDWANWISFQICPECYDKIPEKNYKKCFCCKKQRGLYKTLGNIGNPKYYCGYCNIRFLGHCVWGKNCLDAENGKGKQNIRIRDFRDIESYHEFHISQQCQKCQDSIFNKCGVCKKFPKFDLVECSLGCGRIICKGCRHQKEDFCKDCIKYELKDFL